MRKNILMAACLTIGAVLPISASAKDQDPPPEYGAPPDWQRYRELGEAAVKTQLIDPESAKIAWPNGYRRGGFKPFMSKRVYGYSTCGTVNSRNRMGGYVGETPFVVVIDHDAVSYVEIGSGRGGGMLAQNCADAALPPATEMPGSGTGGSTGFDLTIVPEGAYVSTVAAGSAAEHAGIKPGMVISHINGVMIRGMELSLVRQLLARSEGRARLTIIGGTTLEVDATAPPSTPKPPAHSYVDD